MIALSIILGVACAILLVLLSSQDNKNTKLAVENSLLKGRMEGLQEKLAQQAPDADEPLTAEGIAEAVRRAGYVPEVNEKWVRFMIQGEPFYVETGRLPQVFVLRQYNVDTKEWEMDILRHAAHVMSDDLIMIKATFDDDVDENVKIIYKTPKEDIPDQIRKYHDLYKDGIITEEEFESKKKELLDL